MHSQSPLLCRGNLLTRLGVLGAVACIAWAWPLTAASAGGRDVGFVQVRQVLGDRQHPLPYDVTFAFAFKAFIPDGTIHHVE